MHKELLIMMNPQRIYWLTVQLLSALWRFSASFSSFFWLSSPQLLLWFSLTALLTVFGYSRKLLSEEKSQPFLARNKQTKCIQLSFLCLSLSEVNHVLMLSLLNFFGLKRNIGTTTKFNLRQITARTGEVK